MTANTIEDTTATTPRKFKTFRAKDASTLMELELMSVEFPADARPLVTEAVKQGLKYGDEVKVLYSEPGFSLTHAWIKKNYPLSLHTHDSDCLYVIISGQLQLGNELFGKGDGFFIPANVPYIYKSVGDNGVEVLEFRHAESFNFKGQSNVNWWQKAVETVKENAADWQRATSPLVVSPSSAEQQGWHAVVDQYWAAFSAGDMDAAIGCCSDDFKLWHSFDQKVMNRDESAVGWRQVFDAFETRTLQDVRRDVLPDGIVQRHVLVVSSKDGAKRAWPVCLFMRFSGGKISAMEEYIDRAGSYVLS